jgi:glycosyltransferase involved in cell wall biosynthesis
MRILIVSQYFWPENFRINDIAVGLQEKGHQVTVLTGLPNYPEGKFYPGYSFFNKSTENWQGIEIIRAREFPRGRNQSWRLALNYISFVFFAGWKAFWLKSRFDKVLVFQQSPIFLTIPAIIVKKRQRIPLYVIVQDLWPESLLFTGKTTNKLILQLVLKVSDYIYHQADCLLLPSNGFKDSLSKRGVDVSAMHYLPNSTESYYQPVEKDDKYAQWFTGKYHLLLAGNIGEAQGLHLIINAAKELHIQHPDLRWILLGDGRMRVELELLVKELGLENIIFFPGRVAATEVPKWIAWADATLLTLKKDPLFAVTIPSRLQTYMACGKPVLASIDGEAAQLIREADCGLATPAEDTTAFVQVVQQFLQTSVEKQMQWGRHGREYYLRNFERNYLIEKLHQQLSNETC